MASFIWGRNPDEAYQNPYEYEAQDQFIREATLILDKMFELLMDEKYTYTRDDTSLVKALYMLHVDSIDSLRDGISLIENKKHRIAARVLRDVLENISLCNYFYFDKGDKSKRDLETWFNDGFVMNRVYRESLKKRHGKSESEKVKKYYEQLSKITHRTYRTLAYGYTLGSENRLVYEGKYKQEFLVLPHTIAMYMAVFANLIELEINEIKANKNITDADVDLCLLESYENAEVGRKYEGILTNGYIKNINIE